MRKAHLAQNLNCQQTRSCSWYLRFAVPALPSIQLIQLTFMCGIELYNVFYHNRWKSLMQFDSIWSIVVKCHSNVLSLYQPNRFHCTSSMEIENHIRKAHDRQIASLSLVLYVPAETPGFKLHEFNSPDYFFPIRFFLFHSFWSSWLFILGFMHSFELLFAATARCGEWLLSAVSANYNYLV